MDVQACLGVVWKLTILVMLEIDIGKTEGVADVYKKECAGTNTGLGRSGDSVSRYESYRQMYENCTRVTKNLEIVYLELTDARYDFAFLENIREIDGYVLIYGNLVKSIRLKNLRVIRGFTQFQHASSQGITSSLSLIVAFNSQRENDTFGLEQLDLTSLVEIPRGDVMFQANRRLCFGENTIHWTHIFGDRNAMFLSPVVAGFPKMDCTSLGTCSESCKTHHGRKFCWGNSADMCQNITICGVRCPKRCTEDGRCCVPQCTAGCTGISDTDCLSCSKYALYLRKENQFKCVNRCVIWETNDKFALGTRCVERCPQNMVSQTIVDNIYCFTSCLRGYTPHEKTGECMPCANKCPKVCTGNEYWFNKDDVERFRGCVYVVGNLIIDNATFNWNPSYPTILLEDLNALRDVRAVTGAVIIRGWHERMTSLSFLQNLRIIYGNDYGLADRRFTLLVYGSSLQSLGLNSLDSIRAGPAGIWDNPRLCYINGLDLSPIILDKKNEMKIFRNKDPTQCEKEGKVCSQRCSQYGCWGPGDDECVKQRRLADAECQGDCTGNAAATDRCAGVLHVVMIVLTVIITF